MGDPRQARENRAYVRRLLREKQPDFAAALEFAVWDLSAGQAGNRQTEPHRHWRHRRHRIDAQLPGIDKLSVADASVLAARAGTN
jgi:hypothetical protein